MPCMRSSNRGFTLTELLVVLAVICIAASVALPSLGSLIPDFRLASAARDVFSAFQKARSVAAKENAYCAISFQVQMGAVVYDYILYVDSDGDFEYDPGEVLLDRVKLEGGNGPLIDHDALTFADNGLGQPSLAFDPSGLIKRKGNGFGNGTVFLRDGRGKSVKVVAVYSGRIRIEKG